MVSNTSDRKIIAVHDLAALAGGGVFAIVFENPPGSFNDRP